MKSTTDALIDFFAVAEFHDKHEQRFILNLIDDSIIANSDAVKVCFAFKLLDAARAWVLGEGVNSRPQPFLNRRGQNLKLTCCLAGKFNAVSHCAGSEAQISFDLLP